MKDLFFEFYYAHEKKITSGYPLKIKEECQNMYQRFKKRQFDLITGRQLGMFMGEDGVGYRDEELTKRLIKEEKQRFKKLTDDITRMIQKYITSDSVRVGYQKGQLAFSEGKVLMGEEKWQEAVEKYLEAE